MAVAARVDVLRFMWITRYTLLLLMQTPMYFGNNIYRQTLQSSITSVHCADHSCHVVTALHTSRYCTAQLERGVQLL
jgi:hypothetical protein